MRPRFASEIGKRAGSARVGNIDVVSERTEPPCQCATDVPRADDPDLHLRLLGSHDIDAYAERDETLDRRGRFEDALGVVEARRDRGAAAESEETLERNRRSVGADP